MKGVSRDKDGCINLDGFKAIVGFEDDGDLDKSMAACHYRLCLQTMQKRRRLIFQIQCVRP